MSQPFRLDNGDGTASGGSGQDSDGASRTGSSKATQPNRQRHRQGPIERTDLREDSQGASVEAQGHVRRVTGLGGMIVSWFHTRVDPVDALAMVIATR